MSSDSTLRFTNSHFSQFEYNDSYQECAAYMKTKQFMSNRIFEQQSEIEKLKTQLFYQTLKSNQYFDWIRHLESTLRLSNKTSMFGSKDKLVESQCEKDKINLSPEIVTSDYEEEISEGMEEEHFEKPTKPDESAVSKDVIYETVIIKPKKKHSNKSLKSLLNEINEQKKLITNLTNENHELKKMTLSLQEEDLNNSIIINKVKTEKFLIFSELNELILSLKQVYLKKLDKFYELNSKMGTKKSIISSMGIKFNIMSAHRIYRVFSSRLALRLKLVRLVLKKSEISRF